VNINAGEGTGDVSIAAAGNVNTSDGGVISGSSLDVTSTGGSIGSGENPLNMDVNHVDASGQDVTLTNDKDLEIGTIHASGDGQEADSRGDVSMNVNGNVTESDSGSGIYGDKLTATINGNFGNTGSVIDTNVNTVDITAGNIGIDNHSEKLGVENMTADDVNIEADGDIVGAGDNDTHINANSLTTHSQGTTGKADESDTTLTVNVTGDVKQTAEYGVINTKGIGNKHEDPQDQGNQDKGSSSNNPSDTIDGSGGNKVPVPETVEQQLIFATARGKTKKVTLKWTKVDGATSYVIYMAKGKKFRNAKAVMTVGADTLKAVIGKLKKNKAYNFTVVAMMGDTAIGTSPVVYGISGKSFKGKTEAKKIRNVKKKLTVRVNKKKKIKGKVIAKGSRLLKYTKALRFIAEDPTIVKVTKKGVVKGLKKGTTKVYVLTVNGLRKVVKVTVK
ncbi:MAG: fibronectin type III domain-containing protein, partial [Lachnospiraceae bacterium]|nr:fibronectin type III domain-containing protein [Lachnospiraceae bacterium]